MPASTTSTLDMAWKFSSAASETETETEGAAFPGQSNTETETEGAAFPGQSNTETETEGAAYPDQTYMSIHPDVKEENMYTSIQASEPTTETSNNHTDVPIATVSGQETGYVEHHPEPSSSTDGSSPSRGTNDTDSVVYDHLATNARPKGNAQSTNSGGGANPEYSDTLLTDHTYATIKSSQSRSTENSGVYSDTWLSHHTYESIPSQTAMGTHRKLVGIEIEETVADDAAPGPSSGTYRLAYDHFPTKRRFRTDRDRVPNPEEMETENSDSFETDPPGPTLGPSPGAERSSSGSGSSGYLQPSNKTLGKIKEGVEGYEENSGPDPSFGTYREAYDHFPTKTRPKPRPKPPAPDQHVDMTHAENLGESSHPDCARSSSGSGYLKPVEGEGDTDVSGQYIGYIYHAESTGSRGYLKPVNDRRAGNEEAQPGPSFGTYREAYDHFRTKTRPETKPKPKPKTTVLAELPGESSQTPPGDLNLPGVPRNTPFGYLRPVTHNRSGSHGDEGEVYSDTIKTDRTYATISSAGDLSQSSSASNSYLRPVSPRTSTTSSYLEPTPGTSGQAIGKQEAFDLSLPTDKKDGPDSGPSFGTYREAYDHFRTKTRPDTKPKTGPKLDQSLDPSRSPRTQPAMLNQLHLVT